MEEKLYSILRKHKLSLKKREELMVDLLTLFSVSNSVICPNCGCNKLDKHKGYYTCLNRECDFGGKL